MTDNDIKKALEEKLKENKRIYSMDIVFLRNVIAYINRLEAENENYKALYEGLKAEHIETIKAIKHYKAEAYKEFADRLRILIMWSPKNHITITAKDVEMILQDMVGDKNG